MPKQSNTSAVLKTLQKANDIRAKAEKKAKQIEASILIKLKKQKDKLLGQIAQIDAEIARISGNAVPNIPVSPASGTGKRKRLEQTILEIVKAAGSISCAGIQSHAKMVALYAPEKVPSQAVKLASLVKEKKLKKEGKRKKAVYLAA